MDRTIYQQAGAAIAANRERLAAAVTDRHFALNPELEVRHESQDRARQFEDNDYHLSYLAEALAASEPSLFTDYIAWAKAMLAGRGVREKELADNLSDIRAALAEQLPAELGRAAGEYVDDGLRRMAATQDVPPSRIDAAEPLSELADAFLEALLRGRRDQAAGLIMTALDAGLADVRDIYLQVFQRTQHEIGRLWQINRLSVAQEHYCTAATQMIMSQLYPRIFSTARRGRTLVATCVSGDLHEIGVRMVSDFFEMDGWDTFYLGANTPAAAIVGTVVERAADLLLISATMTFHLRHVRELIELIRRDEAARAVKIMVGGYPFNVAPELWREFGADGCAADAEQAVATGERLIEGAANRG